MSAQLLPNGRQQFVDQNGNPLVSGLVYFYVPNTTTPKNTWQDSAQTILNPNPIVLDARGQATIFGSGDYRQVLQDAAGNTIWDKVVSSPITSGALSANGASNSGASLVGFDGTTLDQQLLSRISRVVDSISSLRSISKAVYTRALVSGYYSSGDGGGGEYWYDVSDTSSADNGGTIIVAADGGRWKLTPQDAVTAKQFGAKGDGVTIDSVAFSNAFSAGLGALIVSPSSGAYLVDATLNPPSNFMLWVQKNATLTFTTNARFSAYDVDNVEVKIDGLMNFTGVANTAPALTGWPNIPGEGFPERGLIEFGGLGNAVHKKGFRVHGSGKIDGGWAGTPSAADVANWATWGAVNMRGIFCIYAADLEVRDLEVSGIQGDAVCFCSDSGDTIPDETVSAIAENLYVHNCRFNALNPNGFVGYRGVRVSNNYIDTCGQGIEVVSGNVLQNYIYNVATSGVIMGGNQTHGPLHIQNNIVEAGSIGPINGYDLSSSATGTNNNDIIVAKNIALNVLQKSFNFSELNNFEISGNMSRGHGSGAASYAFILQNCNNGTLAENYANKASTNFAGQVYFNLTSCNNVIRFGNTINTQPTNVACSENLQADASYIDTSGKALIINYDTTGNVVIGSAVDTGEKLQVNGSLKVVDGSAILHLGAPMTNYAGTNTATFTNAPSAGNPTKWIGINDNGIVRAIPMW